MSASRSFDDLVAEAEAEPVEGWDFSWLDGRATEARPSWGYSGLLVPRVAAAGAVLDIQTGGGEVLAGVLAGVADGPHARGAGRTQTLPTVTATESWPPNLEVARRNLAPFGVEAVQVEDEDPLPFADASFDLVISRHPTVVLWDEIARVLAPGGTYLSQQVGSGTNRELTDYLMGSQPVSDRRSPSRAVAAAEAVGLEVVDLRHEALEARFFDIGAVVYFLRKVLWTVPGFTVEAYRPRLSALHRHIEEEGSFVSTVQRFLIEARRLGG